MIRAPLKHLVEFYRRRQRAYLAVFDPNNVYTKEVLQDLALFCRGHKTTFHADARVHAMLEGRREVWLRIQEQLQLTPDQIYDLHVVKNPKES